MKKILFVCVAIICVPAVMFSQSVVGKWTTYDDKTGKEKSIVEIYERNSKIYGRIVKIFDAKYANAKCVSCKGEKKNKPVLGLFVIEGLTKDGSEYRGGEILDPENGKTYKCIIKPNGKDKLDVRGYVGLSFAGRTQTWIRVK